MMPKAMILAVGLAFAATITGCRVHVDKDANGVEKNVQVDTPFGGVHVNTDQLSASDMGIPAYPGAESVLTDDKHKSADVRLGFGEWQMRVRALKYETADSQDKVVAFYKKALSRYGDVITCQGNTPVGTPTRTAEGLTCEDKGKHGNVKIDGKDWDSGNQHLQLKAGSIRHQHIIGFEDEKNGKTRFAMVALDLPSFVDDKSEKSD